MRAVNVAVAIAVASLALLPSTAPAEAQQEKRATKQKAKKQAKRPAPKPASTWGGDGIPSCNFGILWVDSHCRRADGKICTVGEEDLLNCI
ncbi:MAG: hypothetical protein ACKVP3_08535 [Hyphomicrobiaceae bacterium]